MGERRFLLDKHFRANKMIEMCVCVCVYVLTCTCMCVYVCLCMDAWYMRV